MSATNTTRTASSPGLPALTRWCRRSVPAYLDDCGEVDVTALALDCARAHGRGDARRASPGVGSGDRGRGCVVRLEKR